MVDWLLFRTHVLLMALIVTACADTPPATSPDEPDDWILGPSEWPTTCDAAARDIVEFLSPQARKELRAVAENKVFLLHFGLGMTVRNRQGFWRGNTALVESCTGTADTHPDDASMEVVQRAWKLVQNE